MISLKRQNGSLFNSVEKRVAAILVIALFGSFVDSANAQSQSVQIDGKTYPVVTFVGPGQTSPPPTVPATPQPTSQLTLSPSANTVRSIDSVTPMDTVASANSAEQLEPSEPRVQALETLELVAPPVASLAPEQSPVKSQVKLPLQTEAEHFEFDLIELAPTSRELLDDYAELPEVDFELMQTMLGQVRSAQSSVHPEPQASTPYSLASHAFEGLGLTEVNLNAVLPSPPTQATAEHATAKYENRTVESLLRSINTSQANLLQMHSIEVPQWLGQIHFAMLRYGSHTDLTLEDAIYTAIQFSPEIEILRADVSISQAEITKQQAGFDWSNFIQSNWDERNVPVASNLDGAFNRLENHTLANKLGITKRTSRGGNVTLGQDLGFADSNSVFFNPINQANSQIALEYQQPLLQGAGLLTNYSRINIAVANAAVSQEQFLAGLQTHILNVIQAYWDLAATRGQFIVLKRSYDRALETATVVSNRVHLDVGPVQSARSEATLGARRAALLRSEFAVVLAQERLLRLMFGQYFRDSVNTEVIPTSSMLGPSREVDMDLELQLGLQCRPEVLESLQVIKRTSIEQGVARNQLLPLLGLTMSVSNRGLRGNNGLAGAFNDQFSFGDPTYGVGVAYELPVGNRAAKANLRQAQIRLVRFQKEFETVVSNVALEIRNACHNVANATQQREATAQAMKLVDRELNVLKSRAELLLDGDNVGPLYLDDLLSTQERLATAELAFLNASTSHALSYFELQRANGSLLRAMPVPHEQ